MTGEGGDYRLEHRADGATVVRLSGDWRLDRALPSPEAVLAEASDATTVVIDGGELGAWDTALPAFVCQLSRAAAARGVETERVALPEGAERLMKLARTVPVADGARRESRRAGAVEVVGAAFLRVVSDARATVEFVGEAVLALWRFARRRARFRGRDLALAVQEAGAEALGIVSLISFLVGAIMAFVGAVQLRLFGAEIYVANLVIVAMAREMAPMMTGIVMAGRTGAAYAAQLGTMTVNEEIDSLRTFGFSPMEFLVLPRMLALMMMLPLLSIYSNIVGLLGGATVGIGMMGISGWQYWSQTVSAARIDDFAVGGIKAVVIGVLVAVAGCMRGMQSGRSASAVGLAATSAVVTAIVWIVVSDAVFSVVFDVVGL